MALEPYSLDEDELRSSAEPEEDVNRDMEGLLRALQSEVTAALQDVQGPSLQQLAWADGLEDTAVWFAEIMADNWDYYRQGAAVFAGGPGQEALVEALQKQAAWSDARRAEAEELTATTRRLQEKGLRRMAGREDLVPPTVVEFLRYVSETTGSALDHNKVLLPSEVAAAERAEGSGVRFVERMTKLAERLRRGAAAFAGRPGEEALVQALQDKAVSAEALCAEAEAFVATMRRYLLAANPASPAGHAGPSQLSPETEVEEAAAHESDSAGVRQKRQLSPKTEVENA